MQSADEEDDQPSLLHEIARILGVSVEAFSRRSDEAIPAPKSDPMEQEMVWLFRTLQSDQDRQRCVAFLRAVASTSAQQAAGPAKSTKS